MRGILASGLRVMLLALPAALAQPAMAQTVTQSVLHTFTAGTDGGIANAGLVQDSRDGAFYGTTSYGGKNSNGGSIAGGTVFKISAGGSLTTLYSFCESVTNSVCTDGSSPQAGLLLADDGAFYGTTASGGDNDGGTVFKITADGTLTTLYSFCQIGANCADGRDPSATLIQGSDGNLYGTTFYGGVYSLGSVFKITRSGGLTTLHSFCSSCGEGVAPLGPLVQGADGAYYGTTTGEATFGGGTVFRITSSGSYSTFHIFSYGLEPFGGLTLGDDGNFYGTTRMGGANDAGTVFKLTPAGDLTTLYSFCGGGGNCTDGANPTDTLILGSDGNFYGTTLQGGSAGIGNSGNANNNGTAFRITPDGSFTSLYSFCSQVSAYKCVDGYAPAAGLVEGSDGNLYGTTSAGGSGDAYGTVYSLSPSSSSGGGGGGGVITAGTGSGAFAPGMLLVLGLMAGLRRAVRPGA